MFLSSLGIKRRGVSIGVGSTPQPESGAGELARAGRSLAWRLICGSFKAPKPSYLLYVIDQMNTLEKTSNDDWELEILFDGREKTSPLAIFVRARCQRVRPNIPSVLLHLS